LKLAEIINLCRDQSEKAIAIAKAAKRAASQRFNSSIINRKITQLPDWVAYSFIALSKQFFNSVAKTRIFGSFNIPK
jgi:hypothetical protein